MQGFMGNLPGVRFVVTWMLRQVGVYPAVFYGVVAQSGSGYAAGNTTAFQTLWTTVATAGGGLIVLQAGFIALNATTLNHALGGAATVSIQGAGGSTILYFHGVTGPFLNIATASGSAVNYGFIRDFQLRHNDVVTSGATLQLGYVANYLFQNIRSIYNSPDKASITSVRLHASASALKFVNCKFTTRADEATLASGSLFPIGLDVAISSGSPGGFEFQSTEFSGCQNRSTGIRWLNTAGIDTVTFSGLCLIKDHATGMRFGFGSNNGTVSNLIASGLTIDGITGQSVHYTPTGTATIANHQYGTCWFYGTNYIFLIDNGGAGLIRGIQINGSYLTGGTVRSVSVGGVVDELVITGNRITCDATAGGTVAIDIGDGSSAVTDVTICGNRAAVSSSSCDAVIRINAAVDSFAVTGNTLRSGAGAAKGIVNTPGTGDSKQVANNSWLA